MRQQEKLEGRVVNIDERLAKLESDKTVMKVGGRRCTQEDNSQQIGLFVVVLFKKKMTFSERRYCTSYFLS